jgi:hypothetical protein
MSRRPSISLASKEAKYHWRSCSVGRSNVATLKVGEEVFQSPGTRVEARHVALLLIGHDGFETRFPGIAAWMQRVEQLPGYEKTYPPHWRQT